MIVVEMEEPEARRLLKEIRRELQCRESVYRKRGIAQTIVDQRNRPLERLAAAIVDALDDPPPPQQLDAFR